MCVPADLLLIFKFFRFQKMEAGLQKDLQALKNGLRHNDPVPKFHYENKTFSLVQ